MSRLTKKVDKAIIEDAFFDQHGYTPNVLWSGRWFVWASEVGEYMHVRGTLDNITFESTES